MANKYEIIDESNWERAMHCMVFRNSIEPAFCVTFEADITKYKNKVKAEGLSFTLTMVYAVCKCANEVEALRYRFLDGKVVLYERVDSLAGNRNGKVFDLSDEEIKYINNKIASETDDIVISQTEYITDFM